MATKSTKKKQRASSARKVTRRPRATASKAPAKASARGRVQGTPQTCSAQRLHPDGYAVGCEKPTKHGGPCAAFWLSKHEFLWVEPLEVWATIRTDLPLTNGTYGVCLWGTKDEAEMGCDPDERVARVRVDVLEIPH